MSQYPMHCRYDVKHGEFSNGLVLRRHYDEAHPEYQPAEVIKGACSRCGVRLRRTSWSTHVRVLHPRDSAARFVEESLLVGSTVNGAVVVSAAPPAPKPAKQVPPPEPVPVFREVDDIVMPVIELMAQPGNVVPVAHLAALFAWRDATAAMLAAVTGDR
jgi:hypothetical protein